MIGRLMFLKKNKSFYEAIKESRKPGNIKAYLPDAETILPIIRTSASPKKQRRVNFIFKRCPYFIGASDSNTL